MSQTTSLNLLTQTAHNLGPNITGTKQPAASYYVGGKNLQTITWNLTSTTAVIYIQATLAENPIEADWFTVHQINASNTTQLSYLNVQGNFVWMRAKVVTFTAGVIQSIKVTY